MWVKRSLFWLFVSIVTFLAGLLTFNFGQIFLADKQTQVEDFYQIDQLVDDVYYFPSIKPETNEVFYQPLKRFDLIFVGYDLNLEHNVSGVKDLVQTIPGTYTHMLAYLGKDSDGYAYAVEMNTDKAKSFSLGVNGLSVGGRLYVFCLGSDYGLKACPQDNYIYGIESYDFMWAKRLDPALRAQLMQSESALIKAIEKDLKEAHPFQLQFHLGLDTTVRKTVPIIDDGRKNGSDCTTYFASLFEEVASVCLDNIRMSAQSWESYYLTHPLGQQAMIPKEYNPFYNESVHIMEMLNKFGFSAIDNEPRQTNCTDHRTVSGLMTPDLVFNSPSLVDIEPLVLKQ